MFINPRLAKATRVPSHGLDSEGIPEDSRLNIQEDSAFLVCHLLAVNIRAEVHFGVNSARFLSLSLSFSH
jgi:hypothetical protein